MPAIFMTLQIRPPPPLPLFLFGGSDPSFLGRWIYEFATAFIRGSKVQMISSFFMSRRH